MRSQAFLSNYKVRLLIIAIAVFLWFHSITEKKYEHIFQVQIVPVNLPEGYVITNQDDDNVAVLFRSSGKVLLRQLIGGKIEITADLGQMEAARVDVNLDLKNLKIPRSNVNIEPIKFVNKNTSSFYFEPLKLKLVSTKSRIEVALVPGYTLVGGIKLSPDKVTVGGPQSVIDALQSIQTKKLKLENINADISGQVRLMNPDPRSITMNVKDADYSVDIQQLVEKEIMDIPIQVFNVPAGIKTWVLPSTLSLKIKGGIELIESVGKGDIIAYVDYTQFETTGEPVLPALIKAPDEVGFFDVFPEKLELKRE